MRSPRPGGGRLEVRAYGRGQRTAPTQGKIGYDDCPFTPPCSRCGHARMRGARSTPAKVVYFYVPPALCRPLRMPLESFKRPQEVYRLVLPKTMRFKGVFEGLRPLRGRVVGADDDPCLSTIVVRSARGYGPLWGGLRQSLKKPSRGPLRGRRCRSCAWSIFDCQKTPKAVQGLVCPSNCFCGLLLSAVFHPVWKNRCTVCCTVLRKSPLCLRFLVLSGGAAQPS